MKLLGGASSRDEGSIKRLSMKGAFRAVVLRFENHGRNYWVDLWTMPLSLRRFSILPRVVESSQSTITHLR